MKKDLSLEQQLSIPPMGTGPAIGDFQTNIVLTSEMSDTPVDEQSNPSWLKRNYIKLSLGTFLVGTAVTIATNPFGELEHDVVAAAPWTAGGIVTTEAMWIGGAALMASSSGKKVGNPLHMHGRWNEISQSIVESKGFQAGLLINTVGALGTAGVVAAGAATALPVEAWPGAFGLAAGDIASTIAIRSGIYAGIRRSKSGESVKTPKVTVRKARLSDIDRLADIDLILFDKAYGQEKPQKEDIVESFTKRYLNNPDWMFVAEMNGVVEGFVSAFQTNVPLEEFVSWENSTANGTLDSRVKPNGKYAYVTNMTIKHEAVEQGAEDMLLANLFANAIREGLEYAYFAARMPHFKRWLEAEGRENTDDKVTLGNYAEEYLNLRRDDGKRNDPQLRMYEEYGYKLKKMVADGFEDDASMNYGVLFMAVIPPSPAIKKFKTARVIIGGALRQIAKNPKLLRKLF